VVFKQKQAQYKIDTSFRLNGPKYLPYVIGKFAFGMLELSESLLKEEYCVDSYACRSGQLTVGTVQNNGMTNCLRAVHHCNAKQTV